MFGYYQVISVQALYLIYCYGIASVNSQKSVNGQVVQEVLQVVKRDIVLTGGNDLCVIGQGFQVYDLMYIDLTDSAAFLYHQKIVFEQEAVLDGLCLYF